MAPNGTRGRREEQMEIERSQDRGVTVVAVRGVINFGEPAQQFSSYLQDLLAADVPAVLVDMSGIDNVDSTGLGELVGYLQRFEKEGRRLALYRPHRRILSLLRLTRLDEIFSIYEDLEEAIVALSPADS
jgi:anti-sigma B factor antagonist